MSILQHFKSRIARYRRDKRLNVFYKQFIKEGDLCFDIGANEGDRTSVFSNLGAKVVSAEPVLESFEILQHKFSDQDRVILINKALGSTVGEGSIHIANVSQVSTMNPDFIHEYGNQEKHDLRWEEIRATKITTLDTLIDAHGLPKFCKIDVEGFELEVLRGLTQNIPMLSFEYNARLKSQAIACIKELERYHSALFNFSPYETMKFELSVWITNEEFMRYIEQLPLTIETGDIYVQLPA